ncbi:MFS transporter [Nocardioides sp. HDW12B]|uniref:MFS transporter n=1 Tax=Nocardioides sp. HDW12B TaxID=2714939 RepID=UPI001409D2EE|nr:MFS transporter [Nocardioides sp. HDW12B]QIK66189.1 MFS transporter [Nocardioides sp. HDW12B]
MTSAPTSPASGPASGSGGPVADDAGRGYVPGTSAYRRVVGALFVAGLATFVLLYSTQALFTELAADFGVTPAQSTLSLSLTTAGLAVTILLLGPLSDRVGRTPLIHLSLGFASLVAVACALAPTWHALLGLRLAQGVALAGLPAVATAYLREELHPSSHARAAGLYIGGTAIGGMAGRLVTGPVADVAGWRWGLAAAAGLGVLGAVVVRVLLPASHGFVPAASGARAAARRLRGALADPALLALYGIGATGIGAFVAVLNATGFRLSGAPFSLGVGAASLVFLVYPIGSVGSVVAGRLAEVLGRRAVVPAGCALAIGGLLLTLPATLPTLVGGLMLMTAGFFVVHGTASGWVTARAHAGGVATGQASSLYVFAYYVGSSVFGTLAGHAWSAGGWPAVVALSGGLLLVATVLALRLRSTPTLLVG